MEAGPTLPSMDIFAILFQMFCSQVQFGQLAESCHGLSKDHERMIGPILDFNAVIAGTEARLDRKIDHLKHHIVGIEANLNSAYDPPPMNQKGIAALKRRAHFPKMSMAQYCHSPVGDSEAKFIICSDGYFVYYSWNEFDMRKNDGPPLFMDVVKDYIDCYFGEKVSKRVLGALLSGEDLSPDDGIIRNCANYFASYVIDTWKQQFKPQLGQLGKRSAPDALAGEKSRVKRRKSVPSEIGGTTERDEDKLPSSQQSNAGSSVPSLPDTEIVVPRTPDTSADGHDENAMGVEGDAGTDDMLAIQLPGSPAASTVTQLNTSRVFSPQLNTEDENAGAEEKENEKENEKGGTSLLITPAEAGDETFRLLPTKATGELDVDGLLSPTRPTPILTTGRPVAPQKPISLDSGNPRPGTTDWGIDGLMPPSAADSRIR